MGSWWRKPFAAQTPLLYQRTIDNLDVRFVRVFKYEKINRFSRNRHRLANDDSVCRTTGNQAGYCATAATAAFLLQTQRIRYWSLRNLGALRWFKQCWKRQCKCTRLGRRHGFHLLVSLEICGCAVPGYGNGYSVKWFHHDGTIFRQLAC